MGSPTEVVATVVQIGRFVQPVDSSKPVEQKAATSTNIGTSKPIEQKAPVSIDSTSRPIEQQAPADFSSGGGNTASIIEQKLVETRDLQTSRPIEQSKLSASFRPIEQRLLALDAAYSRPIEQWVIPDDSASITQFDFIDYIFPACGSIKNPTNTDIVWRIKEHLGDSFATETLVFKVDGVEVQNTSDFLIEDIDGGLQLTYDPPSNFDFDILVSVDLSIQDTASPPNTFEFWCTWQTVPDVRGPLFSEIGPACYSTNVGVLEPITFEVFDVGNGVDPDSIKISVEGINVCDGIVLEAFTTPSGSGYTVTYNHPNDPFKYDAEITIALEASDLTDPPNSTLFICYFTTEESEGPQFINFDPSQCETFVDNTTGLSFEVYGVEQGVDISTLEVRIDNKLRKVFVRPRLLRDDE